MNLFSWLTGDLNEVNTVITDLKTDLADAKADVLSLQSTVTELSGGYLTITTELALVRQALALAGVVMPTPLPPTVVPVVVVPSK